MKLSKCLLLCFVILSLSSCGGLGYFETRNVRIKTEPDAHIFVPRYKDENKNLGIYIGKADYNGDAKVNIETPDYNRAGHCVMIVKPGYEPKKFDLKRKFNSYVLWDIFFPPALLFEKYWVLSEKRTNKLLKLKKSKYTAAEYLQKAEKAKRKSKKRKMYRNAAYQDYNNEQGYLPYAYMGFAKLEYDKEEYDNALCYVLKAIELDPGNVEFKQTYDVIKNEYEIVLAENAAAGEKWRQRLEAASMIMSAVENTVSTVSAINGGSTYTPDYSNSYSSSGSSNKQNYQKGYDVWAKRAEKMYNELTKIPYTGSASTRRDEIESYHKAQREMRNIRTKATAAGVSIVKSKYESLIIND